LEAILPTKRSDVEPQPETIDEVRYEESALADVRARSFPAGKDFFDYSQFGDGNEDDWEDDEDDDEGEPDCRPQ